MEHKLEHRWTFWYRSNKPGEDWEKSLKYVCTVDSIESFWSLYNNIPKSSHLQIGVEYFFFKENIQPRWDSVENKGGGRWYNDTNSDVVDVLWLNLLLGFIGEQYESTKYCGISVVRKKERSSKIFVWTKSSTEKEELETGNEIYKLCCLDQTWQYVSHANPHKNLYRISH